MSIKVLIVDESATARLALSQIISSAPDMEIVGQAAGCTQAVEMVQSIGPDVVLMDVLMPHTRSIDATREIMHLRPTPIVIVSAGLDSNETNIGFEAISAGALSVLQKPGAPHTPGYPAQVKELVNAVRAMSGVAVIHHPRNGRMLSRTNGDAAAAPPTDVNVKPQIVAIVASTGGPQTIGTIIRGLPSTFSLPIVIVQHITPDFIAPLGEWLGTVSRRVVRIAEADQWPAPRTIYFAPSHTHLQFSPQGRFELTQTPAYVPHIPSGDVLLESVAAQYGAASVGIVLTGMGKDGARGLHAMRRMGAVTIAQDEASCVVFGMPQEAIALGAAQYLFSPPEISKFLGECAV